MSLAARLQVADAATDTGDAGRSVTSGRMVRVFARAGDERAPRGAEPPSEADLTATIDLVRRAAGRVRSVHDGARTAVLESLQIARTATASAQAAQARADMAEARAQAATAEAERAGLQVRELSAKLAAAEARAGQAETRAEEAQLWLRRIHDCMANEFTALTVAPV